MTALVVFGKCAGRSALWLLVALGVALVWLVAAPQVQAAPRAKLTVKIKPAVAAARERVRVSGRVRAAGPLRTLRVGLQRRTAGRWREVARGRVSRKRGFVVRWDTPATPGTIRLRARLTRGRKTIARSRAWRLTVTTHVGPVVSPPPVRPIPAPTSPGPTPPETPPQTLVIEPGSVESAADPGQPGVLRLQGAVPVKPGDVLASGIGDAAPYGFLVKATAVRSDGSDTLVDVVPATLLEALPEGQIDQAFTSAEAAQRRSSRRGSATRFRKQATCSAGGTVTIEGSADLGTPVYDIEADWGYLSLESAKATASVTASAHASATAEGTASCTVGPIKLFDKKFVPITFSVGPVPIVLVPELEVELEGLGQIDAAVATSVDASLTATAGAEYAGGDLSPIAELSESFEHEPPDPGGSALLTATLGSELELKFYGAGGPAFNFNAGLEMNANPDEDPWWTLDAPVSLTAGLEIDVLDLEAGPITVYENSFRLAEAPTATWTGTITIDATESGPAYASEDGGTGTRDRTARSVLQIDHAPGSPDGDFSQRGVTVSEYAYSESMTEPGLERDWISGGECTYSAQGSSSAVTGKVSASINGAGILGFGWGPEDSAEPPRGDWTFTESETCSPNGFGIDDRDGVIYGGLGVCAHSDDDVFFQHYHVPLTQLVSIEGGERVMRGSTTEACQTAPEYPTTGSATLTFDLVYGS